MSDETIELTEVQAIINGLSSPTDEQFVQAVRGYSDGAVASAAAKLALAGGGGGGDGLPDTGELEEDSLLVAFLDSAFVPEWSPFASFASNLDLEVTTNKGQPDGYAGLDGDGLVPAENLPEAAGLPAWWTVDSTPGSEEVAFAGIVEIAPADPAAVPEGALYITLPIGSRDQGTRAIRVIGSDEPNYPFQVDVYGAAELRGAGDGNGGGSIGLLRTTELDGARVFQFTADQGDGTGQAKIGDATTEISFFGADPVPRPAVPADINDVIAGLQALGLFAV